eukprot:671575_1
MSVAVFVCLSLLFKNYKAQCLSTQGLRCNAVFIGLPAPYTGPPYSFIQTFNVSSCISNHQLTISEISIWYKYEITTAINYSIDFNIELFNPSSLHVLTNTDVNNKIATAQTSLSLITTGGSTEKRITFTNLNIALGCYPFFAMFVYPLNCNGSISSACDSIPALKKLNIGVCEAPNQQETLFVYDATGTVPPDLTSINITHPKDSMDTYRMAVDIVFHNTTLCSYDTPNPTLFPTVVPSNTPSNIPSVPPSNTPSNFPPSVTPSNIPSNNPTIARTSNPSDAPSKPTITLQAVNPSSVHSSPTITSTYDENSDITSSMNQSEESEVPSKSGESLLPAIAVAATLCIVITGVLLYCLRRKYVNVKGKETDSARIVGTCT